MAHNHEHSHGPGQTCPHHAHGTRRSLLIAFCMTAGFMLVEAVGGWLTNSLALLSDAGHMLTDAAALGLSLLAARMAEMPPSPTKTFGYRRFEILAALLNGLALWAIVGVILREAYERFQSPVEVEPVGMMVVAALGLGVNLVSIATLHRHKDSNINVRGAFLHVAADSLGSVGALTAGVVLLTTGWTFVDPLVSVAICLLILWSSWGLVKESVHILLLGVPARLDYREIQEAILDHEGVCCLYDLHVWTIAGGDDALSAHVVVPDGYPAKPELLRRVIATLRERFQIEHATLQLEESHDLKRERLHVVCSVAGDGIACGVAPPEDAHSAH